VGAGRASGAGARGHGLGGVLASRRQAAGDGGRRLRPESLAAFGGRRWEMALPVCALRHAQTARLPRGLVGSLVLNWPGPAESTANWLVQGRAVGRAGHCLWRQRRPRFRRRLGRREPGGRTFGQINFLPAARSEPRRPQPGRELRALEPEAVGLAGELLGRRHRQDLADQLLLLAHFLPVCHDLVQVLNAHCRFSRI